MPGCLKTSEMMTDPEVEEAILRVQDGSIEVYRTVLTAYHRRLRNVVAGLCPPSVDCDEIAHTAFVEAYRRIGQYRPNTNFFAWLVGIARNLVRAEFEKIQRRARNERNFLDHLVAQQLDRLADEDPDTLVVRTTFLAECLAQLNADAQALLGMRYQDALRVREIATRQGRSADAVSVQLFGLRKILRDCVAGKSAAASSTPP
jgi:RNA polymerase sigma-70 factor (ECF subfamily)